MLLDFFLFIFWGCGLVLGAVLDPQANNKTKNHIVLDAVNLIFNETVKLDVILQRWDGTLSGAMEINGQTNKIMKAIDEGTKAANASRKLHVPGALKVGHATNKLIKQTRNVTMDLMYMKDRFRVLTLAGSVKANLKKMQAMSDTMNNVVVRKLPPIGRPIGRKLGRKTHRVFQKAIDEYESKDPAPIPPPPKPTKTKKPKEPKPTETSTGRGGVADVPAMTNAPEVDNGDLIWNPKPTKTKKRKTRTSKPTEPPMSTEN